MSAIATDSITQSPLSLSPQQRQQWDDDGYFVVRKALPAATLQRITNAAQQAEDRKRAEFGLTLDHTLKMRNAIVEHEGLWKLLYYRQTFPLVLDLMGAAIQLSTSYLIVPPPAGDETPPTYKAMDWHADVPQVISYDGRPVAMKVR